MRPRAEPRGLRRIVATSLLAIVAACATSDDALTVSDLDGHPRRPLSVTDAAAHVLVFLAPDCPIANSYAPELASLIAEHREDPIQFFLVYVDPEITAAQARQHRSEYGLPGTIVLDPDQRLVRATGVTVTPEAVVVLPGNRLA